MKFVIRPDYVYFSFSFSNVNLKINPGIVAIWGIIRPQTRLLITAT
jgi:hypothetical protein